MKLIFEKLRYFNGKCYNCGQFNLKWGYKCLSCGKLNKDHIYVSILRGALLVVPMLIRDYIGISSSTWLLLYIIIWIPLVSFICSKQKKLPRENKY